MESKFKEEIVRTSQIEVMKNKYLAEKLFRTWKEDFVDEDTGETVSIERKEIILEKGTFLNNNELSVINFHLQSGDITEVVVSNQQRGCLLVIGGTNVWAATIELNRKRKTIYLYAHSLETATNISIDFIEQKYEGSFKFIAIKELDYSNLISNEIALEDECEDEDFYKIEVEIVHENEEAHNQRYIIRASDAEKAKQSIVQFIDSQSQTHAPFEVTIISAKTIPCNDIIDYRFSTSYFENM